MTAPAFRIASRPLDLLLLSLAFTLWVAGLVVVRNTPIASAAAYLVLLEILLAAWAVGTAEGRGSPALRFVMKTQLTLGCRMGMAVCGTLLVGYLCVVLLHQLDPAPLFAALLSTWATMLLATKILLYTAVSIPFVTLWYLHALQLRGLAFADLASGAYLEQELRLASPAIEVQQRLDFYLRALASQLSAPLPTLVYGVRPTLSSVAAADGKALYECVWTWLPVKLSIDVTPDGGAATVIRVRCLLRGGYYRHELAVLPNEAIMLLEHVQSHVLHALRTDMARKEAEQRQEKLRVHALDMRLKVLQAQVEPHFLFNTMANLRHLYRSDVVAGEDMLNHLISYLRGAMDGLRSEQSTVLAELDLVRHYLALMKVRMGERLSYSFVHHDEIGLLAFPPAMLISLVENAIKHGLQDSEDGQLRITAARTGEQVAISVTDNGTGFGSVAGTGVGLSNIRQRLEAIYGHAAWLEVGTLAAGGFVSTIVVPVNKGSVHA